VRYDFHKQIWWWQAYRPTYHEEVKHASAQLILEVNEYCQGLHFVSYNTMYDAARAHFRDGIHTGHLLQ